MYILEILVPIISASSALAGVWLGKWLERGDRDRQFTRESLLQINKFLLVWSDSALSKLPLGLGTTEEYLRDVNDRIIEAKAMLEVIGSVDLNLSFDDLKVAVIAMLDKEIEYRASGKLNPNMGIEQFSGEPVLEALRLAKRQWIDTLRKEVGVESVKMRKEPYDPKG